MSPSRRRTEPFRNIGKASIEDEAHASVGQMGLVVPWNRTGSESRDHYAHRHMVRLRTVVPVVRFPGDPDRGHHCRNSPHPVARNRPVFPLPPAGIHRVSDVARTPEGTVNGDTVKLHNVRDFEWLSETDFIERWETRTYRLSDIRSVDLGLSYWGMPAIAHTLVSFGFADGRHVVFSVGIRQEAGEEHSEIGGFFKKFELAFTAGEESDVLRLRTNIRKEDVYLYPLDIPPEGARALFLSYVNLANDLADKPQFYNTLTANCTTVVFDLVRQIDPGLPFDWRIVLTGYLPSYVQEHSGFLWKMPLEQLRRHAAISARGLAADGRDVDYSVAIREGR